MKVSKFEDLLVWQKAKTTVIATYKAFKECKECKDYSFRDQIQRAVVSIMNNIAEGFGSKGSCAEVRSMLYLALEFKYITRDEQELLYNQTVELTKMLTSFINNLALRTKD